MQVTDVLKFRGGDSDRDATDDPAPSLPEAALVTVLAGAAQAPALPALQADTSSPLPDAEIPGFLPQLWAVRGNFLIVACMLADVHSKPRQAPALSHLLLGFVCCRRLKQFVSV